jgi:hypothetical protein
MSTVSPGGSKLVPARFTNRLQNSIEEKKKKLLKYFLKNYYFPPVSRSLSTITLYRFLSGIRASRSYTTWNQRMRLRDSNDQLAIDGRQPPELKKIEKKRISILCKNQKALSILWDERKVSMIWENYNLISSWGQVHCQLIGNNWPTFKRVQHFPKETRDHLQMSLKVSWIFNKKVKAKFVRGQSRTG